MQSLQFLQCPKTSVLSLQSEKDAQLLPEGDRKQQGLLLLVLLVGAGKGKQEAKQKVHPEAQQPPDSTPGGLYQAIGMIAHVP